MVATKKKIIPALGSSDQIADPKPTTAASMRKSVII
jgi:hypothetical protein